MPRIKCHYIDCQLLDDGYCSAALVEIDPGEGCLSFQPIADGNGNDDWDEEDELDEWEEGDELEDEDEDDTWGDDDDLDEG
jgi:hypothetical protein